MAAMAAIYSWVSNQNELNYFDILVIPMIPIQTTGLSFQEKKQIIDFQDGGHSDYLEFPIGTILVF